VWVNGALFARVDGIDRDTRICVVGGPTYPREATIVLDPANEVPESDESNNESMRFLPIPSRPPSCTATPTPTVTPTPPPLCPGDCNDDGKITVDELILGVNLALDRAGIDTCPGWFPPGGCPPDRGCVHLIVGAVEYALRGCP
jgi:hypothetical protein